MDWGLQNRISRIIKPNDNRALMLAVDHGYFLGPTEKLEIPRKTIAPILKYCDSIMLTRGVQRTSVDPKSSVPIVLRVSGGSSIIGEDLSNEQITVSIKDAIRLNASALAMSIFVGSKYEQQTIVNLGRLVNEAEEYGIPVLAVTAVGKEIGQKDARYLSLACRIAAEQGAHIVKTYYCEDFDKVTEKCVELLRGKTISLITDSQHLNQIELIKNTLEEKGVNVKIGKGKGQLNDGQVFGCEFYPATETIDDVDANVFLGQSNFHAAGVALATNKPTYILDPYFNEIREITDFARKLQKKATLEIYKAADAETFGVIVGLKEGQLSKLTALKFKKELESEGKTVHLIALTDITNERLRNLKNIDAFIQVACPRISTDNKFDKPVLSTPQAIALMKVLRKENIESYFQIKHWL